VRLGIREQDKGQEGWKASINNGWKQKKTIYIIKGNVPGRKTISNNNFFWEEMR
jgi:hypothetical protein